MEYPGRSRERYPLAAFVVVGIIIMITFMMMREVQLPPGICLIVIPSPNPVGSPQIIERPCEELMPPPPPPPPPLPH